MALLLSLSILIAMMSVLASQSEQPPFRIVAEYVNCSTGSLALFDYCQKVVNL